MTQNAQPLRLQIFVALPASPASCTLGMEVISTAILVAPAPTCLPAFYVVSFGGATVLLWCRDSYSSRALRKAVRPLALQRKLGFAYIYIYAHILCIHTLAYTVVVYSSPVQLLGVSDSDAAMR